MKRWMALSAAGDAFPVTVTSVTLPSATTRVPRSPHPTALKTRKAPSLRGCAPFVVASAPLALCRLVELREVAAEEVARALLHLPDALAREAPLLAQVLQRARIVLRQAVTQDVPGQLAHPLADAAQRIADVLVLLGTQELGIGARSFVGQPIEVGGIAVAVGPQRLLERDVPRRQAAVRHGAADRRRPVLQATRDVGADPPHRVGREAVALLRVEMLDGLEEAVVSFLHQILETDAATHELAGDRDDEAQVVHHELFLRALVALPRLPRHHELSLAVERRVGADQLDQRRQIVEFTAVARHRPSFLSSP